MLRLPVSGLEVRLREPDGADEVLLREMAGSAVTMALALLPRLADGADWPALAVTDFEFLLLGLRAQILGDRLALGLVCPGCGTRVEIAVPIAAYLDGTTPRRPKDVTPDAARTGWYCCADVRFRLPTAGDQAAVIGRPDAARRLAGRCLDPAHLKGPQLRVVERAMGAMAPEVSRPIRGACPECAARVEAPLYVTRLVISELYRDAAGVYDDVDLIAQAYHWPEAEIMALPRRRRRAYAERARRARPLAA